MRKDCENGELRYSEQSTDSVLGHISRVFRGRYLGIEIILIKKGVQKT